VLKKRAAKFIVGKLVAVAN